MTTFQIASDLHIEKFNYNSSIEDYIIPSADNLILAGDIGSLYKIDQLKDFLLQASKLFYTILYIPGNHEYYTMYGYQPITFKALQQRVNNLSNNIKNLYVINRNSVRFKNTCIIGCTLWSQPTCKVPPYIVRIHKFHTEDYINEHQKDLAYIKYMINYCKKEKFKLIIITHHPPTLKALIGAKKRKQFQSLYATDLEYLLDNKHINLWICGHTHKNINITSDKGCKIITNQKGKIKDKIKDYSKTFTIEI